MTDIPNVEEYESNLRVRKEVIEGTTYDGHIYIDDELINKLLQTAIDDRDSLEFHARNVMKINSGLECMSLDRDTLLRYLMNFENCPRWRFQKRGVQGLSLDMGKVLSPLYNGGYAQEFLDVYMNYSSCKSQVSSVGNLITRLYDCDKKGHDGKVLKKAMFNVNQRVNLRYNYSNNDIISSIPSKFKSVITCDEDHVLVWGDFAQSDFRIAYSLLLHDRYNEKFMLNCDDMYEAMARLLADYNKEEFDYSKFKEERDIYKVYTLQTIYGTSTTTDDKAQHFITQLSKYLNDACPRYKEYKSRLKTRLNLDLPIIIHSYFGHTETIPSDKKDENRVIDFALNSPIQTGTSELIILTCNKIIEQFRNLGYDENDVSLYMVRHDEPIFLISKNALKDLWVFNNASLIQVDDWVPIRLDFSIGKSYTVKDEELTLLMEKTFKENENKLDHPVQSYGIKEWFPVPDIHELAFYYETVKTEDGENFLDENGNPVIIAGITDNKYKLYDSFLLHSLDENELNNTCALHVLRLVPIYRSLECEGFHVITKNYRADKYDNGFFIRFEDRNSDSMESAEGVVKVIMDEYCHEHGICYDKDANHDYLKGLIKEYGKYYDLKKEINKEKGDMDVF
jgi:hypothetical protein